MKNKSGFIPAHGNYRELLSYRKAEIVYDFTYRFCQRFLARLDRTVDQMVQAARSGKQNIMEGSKVSGTSKEIEIKLLGVARASLEELLGDYCDFLRVRALPIWEKEGRQARFVRRLGSKADLSYADYREFCETRPAAVVANIAVCLIHQTDFLLDRQIRRFERDFVQEGGLRERMTRARLRQLHEGKRSDTKDT
jgi:four helix bundle suffix protein